MKREVLIFGILVGIIAIGLVTFSYMSSDKIPLSDDSRLVKQQILKKIPLGTNIKTAQKIMEGNGFTCSLSKNSEFAEDDYINGGQKYHKKSDFLYCNKEKGWLLSIKRWQVAVVYKNTRVSGIFVSFGTIEP